MSRRDQREGEREKKRFQAVQQRAIHQILSLSLDFHSSPRKPVAVAVAAICSTIAAVFSSINRAPAAGVVGFDC